MNKEEDALLIDFILRTPTQAPETVVESLASAGVDGVVYDMSDTALSEAINNSELTGYEANVYVDDGAVLFALTDTPSTIDSSALETWTDQVQAADALVIASHPYDRSQGRPWGDRVYRLAGLTHLVTNSPGNARSRDQLALTVAKKRDLGTISASMHHNDAIGSTATVLSVDGHQRADILEALKSNKTLGIRMESADTPYVEPVEPSPQRSSHSRDGGRRGNDRRGRGRDTRGQRRDSGRR